MTNGSMGALIIAAIVATSLIMLMTFLARLFRKAGPNEALIVYGFRGTRVIKGSGTIIFPMIESFKSLSLELMSFDVSPNQELYTSQGVGVTVEAVAQIKVKSDRLSITTAAEQFLTKSPAEREGLIRLVLEGHLRGIIGQLTVEEIVKQPEMVADRMRANCADDMNKMGLEVVSFTIKEVRDKNDYITNMGRPDIARVKRDADVATALADRDTEINRAQAEREAAIARARADQEKVLAEALSQTAQEQARKELEVKKAEYMEQIRRQQAQADKAYDIQAATMEQQVVAEKMKVQKIEKEGQVEVQIAEIARNEKELIATVLKKAEIEKLRIEMLAEADRVRMLTEAEGQAGAIRAQGEAEADIIFRKGEAEAKAMEIKASAYQGWNQAAVVDRLLTSMPDLVRALAAPLANVDKITVVSTGEGNGHGSGMSRITKDMTEVAAQVPALVEALSGMNLHELLGQVRTLAAGREDDEKPKVA